MPAWAATVYLLLALESHVKGIDSQSIEGIWVLL